jgi:hypothetical protein
VEDGDSSDGTGDPRCHSQNTLDAKLSTSMHACGGRMDRRADGCMLTEMIHVNNVATVAPYAASKMIQNSQRITTMQASDPSHNVLM